MARWIQRNLFPLHIHHVGRDVDPTLAIFKRGQKLKLRSYRFRASGHIDMERKHLDRIARPFEQFTASGHFKSRQLGERTAWTVLAGQPLRIEQHERRARFDRDSLLHIKDCTANVGGVHLQRHRRA